MVSLGHTSAQCPRHSLAGPQIARTSSDACQGTRRTTGILETYRAFDPRGPRWPRPDSVASVTTRAAKLVRAHHDLAQAKIYELSLSGIVQAFFEALIGAWETSEGLFALTLPGKMSAGGVPVEMPGGQGVHITVAARREGRTWSHYAAFGTLGTPASSRPAPACRRAAAPSPQPSCPS